MPLLSRGLLVLMGTVLGLLVIEMGLRITQTRPPEIKKREHLPDEPKRQVNKPPHVEYVGNYVGEQVYYDCSAGDCVVDKRIPFVTNEWGFRDNPTTLTKPEGTFRIVVVGDSFTVADGVTWEAAWPQVLETKLNERLDRPVEVINTAVQSYNLREQYFALEQKALRFDPDLVVVGMYVNDALSSRHRPSVEAQMAKKRQVNQLSFVSLPDNPGLRNVKSTTDAVTGPLVVQWITQTVDTWRINQETVDWYHQLWDPEANALGTREVSQALRRFGNMTEQQNAAILVVLFPWLNQIHAHPLAEVHTTIQGHVDEAGLPFLDLMGPIQEADPNPLWCHPSDAHPSAEVHRVAAEAIARELLTGDYGLAP